MRGRVEEGYSQSRSKLINVRLEVVRKAEDSFCVCCRWWFDGPRLVVRAHEVSPWLVREASVSVRSTTFKVEVEQVIHTHTIEHASKLFQILRRI